MIFQIFILSVGLFSTVKSCGSGNCGSGGYGGGMGGYGGGMSGMGGSGGSMGGYGGSMGGMGGYGSGMEMNKPKPYDFSYQANGMGANSFRSEQGDASGNVQGAYGYTDSQGLFRKVQYSAGAGGFKAIVNTNEPGTDSKPESPADVNMNAEPAPAGIQEKYSRQGGSGGMGGAVGGYGMGGHGGFGGGNGGMGGIGGGSLSQFAGIARSGSPKSIH